LVVAAGLPPMVNAKWDMAYLLVLSP